MIGDINMYHLATELVEGKWYRLSLDGSHIPIKLVKVGETNCTFQMMGEPRYYPLTDILNRMVSNKLWVQIDLVRSLAVKLAQSDNCTDVDKYVKYAQIAVEALR
jgi:hypothetical protein